MEMTKSFHENIAILHLQGRFDAHEIEPVHQWLKEQTKSKSPKLIINLNEVNFIDSSGLSTLVQGMKYCLEKNGELVLCDLQQSVRVIFELTRLDRAFTIVSDMQAALEQHSGKE